MRVQRLRGRAGQAQRLRRLRRTNGLCEMCLKDGRTTEAVVVDHIKPLIQGGSDEDSNTRNLCQPHHLEVTVEQFGFDVARGTRGIGRDGRPTGLEHEWNRASPSRPPGAAGRRPTPGGSKVRPATPRTPRSGTVRTAK